MIISTCVKLPRDGMMQYHVFHPLQVNFQKECGSDNKCSSNLLLKAHFVDNEDKPYPR